MLYNTNRESPWGNTYKCVYKKTYNLYVLVNNMAEGAAGHQSASASRSDQDELNGNGSGVDLYTVYSSFHSFF